ncbi:GspH/FimT family pseudopilin [Luteimonas sp. A534]
MPRSPVGFTLIEVVTSLSVLSILLAVALPAFSALLEHQRTSAAMASLVSQMSHARLAAVKHRHPVVLCPSTDGLRCDTGGDWSNGWMVFVDRENRRRPTRAADLLQLDLLPRSTHLHIQSSAGRSYLRYLPDGRSAGSNLSIRICNRKGAQLGAVVVNNAGRPRTERSASDTPCPG